MIPVTETFPLSVPPVAPVKVHTQHPGAVAPSASF